MFGFSFESWSEVTGAMYLGQGFEGTWTIIAVVACVVVLAMGSKNEQDHYNKHQ